MMKMRPLLSLISMMTLAATALPSIASEVDAEKTKQRFQCNLNNDETATTLVNVGNDDQSQNLQLINWSAEYFRSEEEATKLCKEISQQLQTFHEQGELNDIYLLSGNVDQEAVVCLGKPNQEQCNADSVILFTMKTEENHNFAFNNLLGQAFQADIGDFKSEVSARINMNIFSFF